MAFDDVRAPDPSKRQRRVGATFDASPLRRIHDQYRDFAAESIAAIDAVAKAPGIASAFVEIMYQGTYADARMHAKNEGKWLLNLVASGFVFWQDYRASEHGKTFCTLYQIAREKLPLGVTVGVVLGVLVLGAWVLGAW
ncbi:hypothetical protein PybrP1_001340, partial [[Pythium] brassicae (nom. inval.)]